MTLAAITGASGLLGGNLAALLLAEGVKVKATRRGISRIDHLAQLDIEWVDASLDARELTRAFMGADVALAHPRSNPRRDHVAADARQAAVAPGLVPGPSTVPGPSHFRHQ